MIILGLIGYFSFLFFHADVGDMFKWIYHNMGYMDWARVVFVSLYQKTNWALAGWMAPFVFMAFRGVRRGAPIY